MKENRESSAIRIKTLMNERGLRQVDILRKTEPLQKALNIPLKKSTLSQYVNGKQEPDQARTYLLSKFFQVNEAWLSGYDVPRGNLTMVSEQPATYTYNSNSYNYFNTGLSAGMLSAVDPFTELNTEKITLSDTIMGKYAGDQDIFITHVNGESMNRIIPNHSMIGVKQVNSVQDIKDGDIVVFQDNSEMSIKRFYLNKELQIISFIPDSSDDAFKPIMYQADNNDVKIIGKVVIYTVEL